MVEDTGPVGAAPVRTQPRTGGFGGFVVGTMSEILSAPVSLMAASGRAELLSTGLIAAVVPPGAQLPAAPPTGGKEDAGMPNPASLMSLAIISMATRIFC